MKNFLFISCNFPKTYYHFTEALKKVGFNVIGMGDTPFGELQKELLDSLCEYYFIPNLEDYGRVECGVQEIIGRYGNLEFVESNNEYWLGLDAHLRTMFNITTGKSEDEINMFKSKSLEKEYFKKANVKCARYIFYSTFEEAKKFAELVSYPLIIKPDNGVGGHSTYKINNENELKNFFENVHLETQYIIEEFINGELVTFDGVTNKNADVVYCSNEVFPDHFDCVEDTSVDIYYYGNNFVPEDLREAGTNILKVMNARYRYFHIEFLRLKNDKPGLGKAGEVLVMETNMRAPGGYTPEVINFATGISSYEVFAKAMADQLDKEIEIPHRMMSAYIGRRNAKSYLYSTEEINNKYKEHIVFHQIVPCGLEDILGDVATIATFETLDEVNEFFEYTTKKTN